MKFPLFRRLSALAAFALLLGLAACGGGSGSVAISGPGSGGAFSGTTISINPTLEFSFGGVVRYTNTESGSSFPPAASVIAGTYAYAPGADFSSGTLTLTLPDPVGTVVITLRNFKQQGDGAVAAFDAVYGGRTFTAAVQGGTLAARPKAGGGSGGGSGADDSGEAPAAAIPPALQGTRTLVFQAVNPGLSQYEGRDTTAIITATTLQLGQNLLSNPVFLHGATNEWIFKGGDLWFSFSQTPAGGLSEITVTGPNGVPFYGVFASESAGQFTNSAGAVIIAGAVTAANGGGSVNGYAGAGTLRLSGSNTYTGGTVVTGGTLSIAQASISNPLQINVADSAAFITGATGVTIGTLSVSPTSSASPPLSFSSGTSLYSPGFAGGVLPYAGFTAGVGSGGLVLAGTSTTSTITVAGGTLTLSAPIANPLLVQGGSLVLNYAGLLLSSTVSAPSGPVPVPSLSLSAALLLPGGTVTVATTSTTLLPGTYRSFSAGNVVGTISASSIQVVGTLDLGGATVSNPLLLQNSDGQTYQVISTASVSPATP
jgi:fibronectin-binding autotransporter adhesin